MKTRIPFLHDQNKNQDRVQQVVIKTIENCSLKTNSTCLIEFLL